jgi:predicted ABC-type ATPase
MTRPVILVLAGVNGTGKSSIGGYLLTQGGDGWFNPDAFARELRRATGCSQEAANAAAWAEGVRRLDEAIAHGTNHAFETTLGGTTIAKKLRDAARTHDVVVWFCGLSSPEQHVRRVAERVTHGGHDIPEAKIRERYPRALQNLIALMPHLSRLAVYDNSTDVGAGEAVPDPMLVLRMDHGNVVYPMPDDAAALAQTPEWAKPLVETAFRRRPPGA